MEKSERHPGNGDRPADFCGATLADVDIFVEALVQGVAVVVHVAELRDDDDQAETVEHSCNEHMTGKHEYGQIQS